MLWCSFGECCATFSHKPRITNTESCVLLSFRNEGKIKTFSDEAQLNQICQQSSYAKRMVNSSSWNRKKSKEEKEESGNNRKEEHWKDLNTIEVPSPLEYSKLYLISWSKKVHCLLQFLVHICIYIYRKYLRQL